MKTAFRRFLILLFLAGFPIASSVPTESAESWPRFRGPRGDGVADEPAVPVEFGPEKNLAWKTHLVSGHSSPVISGDQIFLTGYSDKEEQPAVETICLDRNNGNVLWRKAAPAKKIVRGHRTNSPAAPTPALGDNAVYVYFDSFGLLAYDFEGNELWRKPLRRPRIPWGVGCSPVLAGDLLILNQDQDLGSHVLAVDASTGDTRWKTDRPECRRGFSTPIVLPDQNQVVLSGSLSIVGYNLSDGSEVWRVRGLPYQVSPSPVHSDGMIYFAGWDALGGGSVRPLKSALERYDKDGDGNLTRQEFKHIEFAKYDRDKDGTVTSKEYEDFREFFEGAENSMLAIEIGGQGDITQSHVKWKAKSSLPHIPSVLAYRGRVYSVTHGGIAVCYRASDGEMLFRSRLPAQGYYSASPTANDGHIYFCSGDGTVSVIKAADEYEVVAENRLGERINASPAIVDGRIYVRTEKHLYAFGE